MLALIKSVSLVIAAVYIGFAVYLYIFQNNYIYLTRFTSPVMTSTNFELNRGDVVLRGWVINGGHEHAILYFGGNAEHVEANIHDFRRRFPYHTVYLVSYRGYGDSEGTPREQLLYGDALALYDEVKQRHTAISLVGRSLGSGVATYVAANRPTHRLALISPYATLEDVAANAYPFLPVRWLMRDRYRSYQRGAQITAPTLVRYAEYDQIVPQASAQKLVRSLSNTQVEVVPLKGVGHNTLSEAAGYWRGMARFISGKPVAKLAR